MKRAFYVIGVLCLLGVSFTAGTSPAMAGAKYRVSLVAPASVTVGKTFVVSGRVAPGAVGKAVSLQALVQGRWRTVASARLAKHSTFRFVRPARTTGVSTYRVVKPRSPGHAAGASRSVRVKVVAPTPRGFASVSMGFAHVCALKYDKSLWCWGNSSDGELGLGDPTYYKQPVRIGKSSWRSVSAGSSGTCGVRTDGTLWCWGTFEVGPPIAGVQANRYVPTRVGSQNTWSTVSTGATGVCAIRANRTAACWTKDDVYAQDAGNATIPVDLSSSTWVSLPLSVRGALGCGIRSDRHLWCQPTTPETALRLFDPGSWNVVAPGWGHSCGIKTDTSLWCWGSNTGGATGPHPTSDRPNKFDNAQWRTVAAGQDSTCGIKSNGTLWCWGDNTNGKLGAGANAPSSSTSALQVGSANGWTSVSVGTVAGCATRTDGSLWCWGDMLAPGQADPGGPAPHPTPFRMG